MFKFITKQNNSKKIYFNLLFVEHNFCWIFVCVKLSLIFSENE